MECVNTLEMDPSWRMSIILHSMYCIRNNYCLILEGGGDDLVLIARPAVLLG